MIDLDQWEREAKRKIKLDADLAMWRLSQRHGWGIQHPMSRSVSKIAEEFKSIETSMRRAMESFATWFLPRYYALCNMGRTK